MDKKSFEQIINLYNNLKQENICKEMGKNKDCPDSEKQTLYGDVSDYIHDCCCGLTLYEEEILSRLIIGDYVIKNCLL